MGGSWWCRRRPGSGHGLGPDQRLDQLAAADVPVGAVVLTVAGAATDFRGHPGSAAGSAPAAVTVVTQFAHARHVHPRRWRRSPPGRRCWGTPEAVVVRARPGSGAAAAVRARGGRAATPDAQASGRQGSAITQRKGSRTSATTRDDELSFGGVPGPSATADAGVSIVMSWFRDFADRRSIAVLRYTELITLQRV